MSKKTISKATLFNKMFAINQNMFNLIASETEVNKGKEDEKSKTSKQNKRNL